MQRRTFITAVGSTALAGCLSSAASDDTRTTHENEHTDAVDDDATGIEVVDVATPDEITAGDGLDVTFTVRNHDDDPASTVARVTIVDVDDAHLQHEVVWLPDATSSGLPPGTHEVTRTLTVDVDAETTVLVGVEDGALERTAVRPDEGA